MRSRVIYWVPPFEGVPTPNNLACWDAMQRRLNVAPILLGNGICKFVIPDCEKNDGILDLLGKDWSEKEPELNRPVPKKAVEEKPEEPQDKDRPTRRVTKIEVMDILAKRNIKYRLNEKAEALWEKLPDDVKRNCILDKPEREI